MVSGLRWLGRQGTRAVAASVFLGLALPPLSALMKPLVTPAIVALLVVAFLRVEPVALRAAFSDPRRVAVPVLVMMIAAPLAFAAVLVGTGVAAAMPGLALALMIYASTPPLMSVPAFAALLGLDVTLSLAILVTGLGLVSFSAPLFVALLGPAAPEVGTLGLLLRLVLLVGGAALLASLARRLIGPDRVRANTQLFDGVNVVVLFVFAVAVMDGVAARLVAEPLFVAGLTALSFALALCFIYALFRRRGAEDAFAIGLSMGNRNLGLMIAALGSQAPEVTWLYVAVAQFPIYLLPQMLKPIARRITGRP